jgi:hypothetical protein
MIDGPALITLRSLTRGVRLRSTGTPATTAGGAEAASRTRPDGQRPVRALTHMFWWAARPSSPADDGQRRVLASASSPKGTTRRRSGSVPRYHEEELFQLAHGSRGGAASVPVITGTLLASASDTVGRRRSSVSRQNHPDAVAGPGNQHPKCASRSSCRQLRRRTATISAIRHHGDRRVRARSTEPATNVAMSGRPHRGPADRLTTSVRVARDVGHKPTSTALPPGKATAGLVVMPVVGPERRCPGVRGSARGCRLRGRRPDSTTAGSIEGGGRAQRPSTRTPPTLPWPGGSRPARRGPSAVSGSVSMGSARALGCPRSTGDRVGHVLRGR